MNHQILDNVNDLDKYVFDAQTEKVMKVYLPYIKGAMLTLSLLILFFLPIYFYTGLSETNQGKVFVVQMTGVMIYSASSVVLISIYPHVIGYLIPFTIGFFMVIATNLSTAAETYSRYEYMFTVWWVIYNMSIAMPHLYKNNRRWFVLGHVYYISKVYYTYDSISTELAISCVWNTTYFFVGTHILYVLFKELYRVILLNEKLVKEMKRLIEVFPEAVIIQKHTDQENDLWSNQQFDDYVSRVNDSIQSFQNLKVRLISDIYEDLEDQNDFTKTLYDLLKENQEKVQDFATVEQQDAEIEWFDNSGENGLDHNEDDGEKVLKRFWVKTLKINWEGDANAHMHVFIDMTDIVKLEEAKNNIKCQKIMFASASHEFRTPLNAILNSYEFMKRTYEDFWDKLIPWLQNSTRIAKI